MIDLRDHVEVRDHVDLRDAVQPFGAEHAWWTERAGVRGVPRRDREREKARAEAARKAACEEAKRLRRDYWSAERLFETSRRAAAAAPPDVFDDAARDPFAVLGLSPGATLEEARLARRQLAMRYHPDRNPDAAGADRMAAVNAAFALVEQMLAG